MLIAKLESSRHEHGINYCLPAFLPLVIGRENQEEERCFTTSSDITGNLISHQNREVHAAARNHIFLRFFHAHSFLFAPWVVCIYDTWRQIASLLCLTYPHLFRKVAEINRLLWVHWFCLFPYAFRSTGLKAPTEHPVLHFHLSTKGLQKLDWNLQFSFAGQKALPAENQDAEVK